MKKILIKLKYLISMNKSNKKNCSSKKNKINFLKIIKNIYMKTIKIFKLNSKRFYKRRKNNKKIKNKIIPSMYNFFSIKFIKFLYL